MAVTQVWNVHWMGLDVHSAAVNAVNGPAIRRRFIDGRLWFLMEKNLCTVLVTSHITWRHQNSAMIYLKIKVCVECVSEFETLHFNTLHDHYSTTLHHHYSTALYSLHFTVLTALHCTHYTAPLLLHSTVLTTLHCTHYTTLYWLHCTVVTTL